MENSTASASQSRLCAAIVCFHTLFSLNKPRDGLFDAKRSMADILYGAIALTSKLVMVLIIIATAYLSLPYLSPGQHLFLLII